ncbi:MAG TPA: TetR/AcrR family transcriptional regulator [Chitinophagaceae bacterium]|nr:TetR/AcrR family transcriptional regulator [Chitinophagaceae bacterium]
MRTTESKAERTRQFIVEMTAPIFNAKGYAGTSLYDLTRATGLTKGGIYGNFENKDAVALAAFDYNFGRVTDYLKERMLATDNAVERLLVYPRVYRHFLEIAFLKPGCPILNTATEADDTHPELRQRAAGALAQWKRAIENQVKRGIARQEIKAQTHPARVATVIISLIEGAVMQAKVTGRDTELGLAMDFLEQVIRDLGS